MFFDGKIFSKKDNEYFVTENLDLTETKNIITHNCKDLFHKINSYCNICFDTMLAAYLINPDRKDFSIERFSVEYSLPEFDCGNEEAAKQLYLIDILYKEFAEKIKENNQEKL